MTYNTFAHNVTSHVIECEHYRGLYSRKLNGCWVAYRNEGEWVAFKTREEAAAHADGAIVVFGIIEGDVFTKGPLYIELS